MEHDTSIESMRCGKHGSHKGRNQRDSILTLKETIQNIKPLDQKAMGQAKQRWDSIAKPLHSLGLLEDAIVQIAGISGTPKVDIGRRALLISCADNGVVAEGVSQSGQEITAVVAEDFLEGKSSACKMAQKTGTDLFAYDVGMARDTKVPACKQAYGTKDMAKDPAMSRKQAVRTIENGIRLAVEKKEEGYRILATGEMGIGNTTTSAAVSSVLLQEPVEKMVGKGAGLSDEGLLRKVRVIRQAIEVNHPDPADPVDVLSKVGGFDIANMAGIFLGGAAAGIPVLIDGFISSVAALCAVRLCPNASGYILSSHVSEEAGSKAVLEALGKKAFLHCEMGLGEGTGAVACLPLLDLALCVYNEMSTFEDIRIEPYKPL